VAVDVLTEIVIDWPRTLRPHSLLDSVIPELIKRAVELGVEKAA
jgi:hypothetical protein